MIAYLANRIITGALTYQTVAAARPDLIADVDQYLTDIGFGHLIEGSE